MITFLTLFSWFIFGFGFLVKLLGVSVLDILYYYCKFVRFMCDKNIDMFLPYVPCLRIYCFDVFSFLAIKIFVFSLDLLFVNREDNDMDGI